jgi:GNAT superfamily N-acetyltransferase
VDIIEVDPLADGAEPMLHAMWETSAAARADREFALFMPWSTAYVSWTNPREDRAETMWAAVVAGEVVGMALVEMPLLDNQHTAATEFFVHPDHQRRGVGTALLDLVVERARSSGRTVLMAAPISPVDRDGAGQQLLAAHGFEVAIEETQKVCDLEATEGGWAALAAEAAGHHDGYRLEAWESRVPDPLVEGYCVLAEAFVDEAPTGDLDYEREVWTAERVRKRDDHFEATGRHQFGVLAYAPDGSCAATTELFVNEAADWRALQGGTLVQPEHRGHRLGMAVKLVNLAAARACFPTCRYVFTSNAGVNAAMNAVNDRLGFRDVERMVEMQRHL